MTSRLKLLPLYLLCWSVEPSSTAQPVEQVRDTQFNYKRGFYSAPITVLIHSGTPGARIRYTLDGSLPSPDRGLGDTNPVTVRVGRTSTLRAIAYREGMIPSNVDTQTYLFVEDVLKQPARIPGYPNPSLPSGIGESVTLDYEMDPEVVEDPRHRLAIRKGLKSIPSVSIVMNRDDLLGVVPVPGSDRIDATRSGIYWGGSMEGSRIGNREGSTRPASIEVLYPERPGANLQVDAAVEGHSWRLLKRSFRLVFKAEYGSGKLRAPFFEEAPLNAGTATAVYDRIVLRSGKNRSWATNWHPSRSTYTRDQWARDTQIAMSGLGSHGTFVHLYINGLYWGLYNACERPDAWFLAAYLGGEAADWFSVNEDGVFHGDPARWNYLRQELKNKDMAVASNYRELQDYLNVTQFADYLILCWYMHNQDWPDYNWFAGHRVNPPQPMMFFVWDSELTWETGPAPAAWVHPRFRSDQHTDEPNMVGIWHSLRRNPDFMTLFADRVYRHCLRDGGALTESESMARWRTLNAFVEDATLAESARWGDARREVGAATRTRENTFYPEAERVAGRMRGNVEQFIDALRRERYYPALDPPRLVYSTSLMGTGSVEVSNPNGGAGVVYYTLNGDDPRASGGTLSPAARSTVGPERITLARSMTMKARVKDRSEWSTLATTPFTD